MTLNHTFVKSTATIKLLDSRPSRLRASCTCSSVLYSSLIALKRLVGLL